MPFFRRVRRRRVLFALLSLLALAFYLASRQDHDRQHLYVPASSPEEVHQAAPASEGNAAMHQDPDSTPDKTDKLDTLDKPDAVADSPPPEETDYGLLPLTTMAYGTTAHPPVKALNNIYGQLSIELGPDYGVPASQISVAASGSSPLKRRRLVFIGDVHGQLAPLKALLKKVDFETGRDHLVLTGDLVNKGPDSAGVVSLAMQLGASAVRGNHEDRVLLAYQSMHLMRTDSAAGDGLLEELGISKEDKARFAKQAAIESEGRRERAEDMLWQEEDVKERDEREGSNRLIVKAGLKRKPQHDDEFEFDHDRLVRELNAADPLEEVPFSHGDQLERITASSLTPDHVRWLAKLPVILHLGRLTPPASATADPMDLDPFHDVIVAHAGLVPGLPLESQDPFAVMTMRSLVHPADEWRRTHALATIAEKIRAKSNGKIKPTQDVNVPTRQVDAEFKRLQHEAYGPDLKRPRLVLDLASTNPAPGQTQTGGHPQPADLVLMPIEGHPRQGRGRLHWAAVWNQYQHTHPDLKSRSTVIYGHDAVTGLAVPLGPKSSLPWPLSSLPGIPSSNVDTGYTFGLDSGCVYGGKLTALIVEADKNGRLTHHIEQVLCSKSTTKRE